MFDIEISKTYQTVGLASNKGETHEGCPYGPHQSYQKEGTKNALPSLFFHSKIYCMYYL
jgi:hypothetical protein